MQIFFDVRGRQCPLPARHCRFATRQGKLYEAGIKAAYLDGKVNTSLAVFRIAQDNVAVQDGDHLVGGTGNPAYRGEKGVTSKGLEAEVSGELARGWQLIAGFARADARAADGSRLQSQRPNNMAHLYTTYRLSGRQLECAQGRRRPHLEKRHLRHHHHLDRCASAPRPGRHHPGQPDGQLRHPAPALGATQYQQPV